MYVLSLSHKPKPSKFYALSMRLGSLRTEGKPIRVTNSGHGNSANSPVNNFGVDAYTMINSAGALVCKDS